MVQHRNCVPVNVYIIMSGSKIETNDPLTIFHTFAGSKQLRYTNYYPNATFRKL